jgi:hypothetical protein
MGYLWDRKKDFEVAQAKLLNAIYENREKRSVLIEQKITYKLKNNAVGKLGFGRLYGSKGGFEQLQREIRGTLCKDYYYDLDIKNCHPCLLPQLARKKLNMALPEVDLWNKDREANLKKIDACREIAKTELCRVFFGGKPTHPFLLPLFEEVQKVSKALSSLDEYTDLFATIKKLKVEEGIGNVTGSFLHYVLATEERKCMLAMKEAAEELSWKVDVLAYDGIQVRKEDKEITNALLESMVEKVKFDIGYVVEITQKHFESFDLPDIKEQVADGVSREEYNAMKERFEETHFYFLPTNSLAEVTNGIVTLYDKDHAKDYFFHHPSWIFKRSEKFGDHYPFYHLWITDPHRRVIHRMDYKPTDDPTRFVIPLKFEYQSCPVFQNQAAIDAFLFLVAINTGRRHTETEYVLNYIAHLLQRPFELPRKALLFIGSQGAGKDMLWDFLGNKVIGSSHYQDYGRNEQFFAPHDTGCENKFLVKLQEADPIFCRRHASDLKSKITEPVSTFNPKGKKEYLRDNYMRLILTTNKGNPLELESSDRRWVYFKNNNELCGNHEKVKELVTALESEGAGRAVADWLLARETRDYHPDTSAPITEMKKMALETEMSSEERFIDQWDGTRASASEVFTQYRTYCMEKELPYSQNLQSFGKRMLILIVSGKVLKTMHHGSAYYKKP